MIHQVAAATQGLRAARDIHSLYVTHTWGGPWSIFSTPKKIQLLLMLYWTWHLNQIKIKPSEVNTVNVVPLFSHSNLESSVCPTIALSGCSVPSSPFCNWTWRPKGYTVCWTFEVFLEAMCTALQPMQERGRVLSEMVELGSFVHWVVKSPRAGIGSFLFSATYIPGRVWHTGSTH